MLEATTTSSPLRCGLWICVHYVFFSLAFFWIIFYFFFCSGFSFFLSARRALGEHDFEVYFCCVYCPPCDTRVHEVILYGLRIHHRTSYVNIIFRSSIAQGSESGSKKRFQLGTAGKQDTSATALRVKSITRSLRLDDIDLAPTNDFSCENHTRQLGSFPCGGMLALALAG